MLKDNDMQMDKKMIVAEIEKSGCYTHSSIEKLEKTVG